MNGLFTGSEPPTKRRNDDQLLYLMLKLPHALALELDRLRRSLGLDCSYALKKLHTTLQPFGDIRAISSAELERIREAAASLQAEPFQIELNRLRGNALVSSNARVVRDFQHRLVTRLAAFGVFLPDYDFNPHVSLCYGDWQPRNIAVPPIRWLADELLLINSVHGKGHEVIDRWQLTPRQGSLF